MQARAGTPLAEVALQLAPAAVHVMRILAESQSAESCNASLVYLRVLFDLHSLGASVSWHGRGRTAQEASAATVHLAADDDGRYPSTKTPGIVYDTRI